MIDTATDSEGDRVYFFFFFAFPIYMEQGRWVGRGGWGLEKVGERERERESQNKSLLWQGKGGSLDA